MNPFPAPASHSSAVDESPIGAGPESVGGDRSEIPAPPASFPPAYVPVRAMEDMLAMRAQQIFKFGHTPERDAQRPLSGFALDLQALARAIVEDIQFHKPPDRIRRRLIKLGALCMATTDRLDNEGNPDA